MAAAGKEEYPLPMTANCWLDKGEAAGKFPTGGPVSRVMEVWRYCAPNIDIIAPDIYVPNFVEICDEYTRRDNPLFIPETATHSYAGPRELYAVGHYHAVCYSPFGFEEMGMPFSAQMGYLFGMDTTDPALHTPQNTEEYAWYTDTLNSMMSLLAAQYGTDGLQAVSSERPKEDTMLFGAFGFRVVMEHPLLTRKDGVCLIVKETEDTFYIVANGCGGIEIFSTDPKKPYVDVLAKEDGRFENGEWRARRRLNGDEQTVSVCNEPVLFKLKLYAYC